MSSLPGEIQNWLVLGPSRLAWVRLRDGFVEDLGGAIHDQGLGAVRRGQPLPAELPWTAGLEGPLPVELHSIAQEFGTVERSDLRAWEEDGAVFLVMTDSSANAQLMGAALQRENEGDLLRERLAGAERLRRDERRARGEVLHALGYELLELGPDGLFRPNGAPSHWLAHLADQPLDAEDFTLDSSDPTGFLSIFLGDAEEFLASQAQGEDVALLSSGVWTEVIDGEEMSFQAHTLSLAGGRGVVAVERLTVTAEGAQTALQGQREAQLSFESLEREVQVKDILLHCIVHDLRGPLSGLVGTLSLLERGDLDETDQAEVIDLGIRQAKRQDEMIRNVLEVFSAEYEALRAFEVDPSAAPDLSAIVRETCRRQDPAFVAGEVGLDVEAPAHPLRVVGRADRLERVLTNLLGNALRHSLRGSAVEVLVTETAQGAELVVQDRGPGVPPELEESLFRRFVQGGSGGAAGLGLYYVAMTVERWGGQVAYEAREGGGARFIVTLCAPEAAPASGPAPAGATLNGAG